MTRSGQSRDRGPEKTGTRRRDAAGDLRLLGCTFRRDSGGVGLGGGGVDQPVPLARLPQLRRGLWLRGRRQWLAACSPLGQKSGRRTPGGRRAVLHKGPQVCVGSLSLHRPAGRGREARKKFSTMGRPVGWSGRPTDLAFFSLPRSYGEYVFDQSWASAYHRTGRSYYPKVCQCVL